MEKPTIFLSHSSSDKEYILKLKNIITKRTAKTVEVFQSSDGESIPFGNNWIHKIEENLKKTKIMLVFVSPKSASSSWIYFESGFAYSKGIKVIPIGISGVDIGSIKPPLNLLQGFNINSEDGLGNLITVINREFLTEFDEEFEASDYSGLSVFDGNQAESKILDHIDKVVIHLNKTVGTGRTETVSILNNAMDKIEEILKANDIQYHKTGSPIDYKNEISSHGIKITRDNEGSIITSISIDSISMYESLINNLFDLYENELPRGWMQLKPIKGISLVVDEIKLSARLHKYGLELSEYGNGFYKQGDINIKTLDKNRHSSEPGHAFILINFERGKFKTEKLYELVNVLIDAKVVY